MMKLEKSPLETIPPLNKGGLGGIFLTIYLLSSFALAQQLQTDPNGNFSMVIPGALLPCDLGPGSLACPSGNPALTITVTDVPAGSSVILMALNAEDEIHKKPNFKMVKKESISIDTNLAIVQTMTFNNLGNVTLPVVVRTIDSVLGTKAFELEVACNQNTCGDLLEAFDEAIRSLHLSQPGQKLKSSQTGSMGNLKNWLKGFQF